MIRAERAGGAADIAILFGDGQWPAMRISEFRRASHHHQQGLDLFDILHRPEQQPVSLEEMDQAIAQAAVARQLAATPGGKDGKAGA